MAHSLQYIYSLTPDLQVMATTRRLGVCSLLLTTPGPPFLNWKIQPQTLNPKFYIHHVFLSGRLCADMLRYARCRYWDGVPIAAAESASSMALSGCTPGEGPLKEQDRPNAQPQEAGIAAPSSANLYVHHCAA